MSRSVQTRRYMRKLKKNGWTQVSQKGSHIKMVDENGRHMTIRANRMNGMVCERLDKEYGIKEID